MQLFGEQNDPLLEEIIGLTLRDYVINQLILESDDERFQTRPADLQRVRRPRHAGPRTRSRTAEPAALRPRTAEARRAARPQRQHPRRSKQHFAEVFPLVRPHLQSELRKYLILRTLKKDLKDTVFGFGPLQDLLRAPTITKSWSSRATRSTSSATA